MIFDFSKESESFEKLIKWFDENKEIRPLFCKPNTINLNIDEICLHDPTIIKNLVDRKLDNLKARKSIMKNINKCSCCKHIFIELAGKRIDNKINFNTKPSKNTISLVAFDLLKTLLSFKFTYILIKIPLFSEIQLLIVEISNYNCDKYLFFKNKFISFKNFESAKISSILSSDEYSYIKFNSSNSTDKIMELISDNIEILDFDNINLFIQPNNKISRNVFFSFLNYLISIGYTKTMLCVFIKRKEIIELDIGLYSVKLEKEFLYFFDSNYWITTLDKEDKEFQIYKNINLVKTDHSIDLNINSFFKKRDSKYSLCERFNIVDGIVTNKFVIETLNFAEERKVKAREVYLDLISEEEPAFFITMRKNNDETESFSFAIFNPNVFEAKDRKLIQSIGRINKNVIIPTHYYEVSREKEYLDNIMDVLIIKKCCGIDLPKNKQSNNFLYSIMLYFYKNGMQKSRINEIFTSNLINELELGLYMYNSEKNEIIYFYNTRIWSFIENKIEKNQEVKVFNIYLNFIKSKSKDYNSFFIRVNLGESDKVELDNPDIIKNILI